MHLGFPDPAKATGTDEEVLAVFRQVQDDIAREVVTLLRSIDDEQPSADG